MHSIDRRGFSNISCDIELETRELTALILQAMHVMNGHPFSCLRAFLLQCIRHRPQNQLFVNSQVHCVVKDGMSPFLPAQHAAGCSLTETLLTAADVLQRLLDMFFFAKLTCLCAHG